MRIHSIENVFDDGDFVSLGLVGLDIRAAQRSEVVQHQMDGDIEWSRTARGIWLLATPSTNGKACPDQNVSSMAHVAARDFGFLTLTRPSTARIYNQTRVSCSRCHPGRACRRQRTFALRRPRCGQRTECRGRRRTHFNAVLRSISGLRRISSPENKKIEGRATALSSVRTAPTTAPSWNLLFARGVQR
jgi:hypothetical protein